MNTRHGTHVILGAITPAYDAVDADTLTYPNLRLALKSQNLPLFVLHNGGQIWRQKFRVSPAALKEDWRSLYLLNVSYRLQKAWTLPEKMFWSAQFTTTSVKLFGRPLSREVRSIAERELEFFEATMRTFEIDEAFADPVIRSYRSLIPSRKTVSLPPIEQRYSKVLRILRDHYERVYADCFAVFDDYDPLLPMTPQDIAESFGAALEVLKNQDEAWQKWEVVISNDSKLSVNVHKRKIMVGKRRSACLLNEARALFAHEVLVHAMRGLNGGKISHDLRVGLPDYLAAEEGLGVLVESAVGGKVPDKIKDRYVDIALALGSWNRKPLNRHEMYVFCFTRAVMRNIASGEPLDLDVLEKVTWEQVNRIYRGSLGNRYIAVFTKDVTYYRGFVDMARYLQKWADNPEKLAGRITYVSQGKFDPTNKNHRQVVRKLTKLSN